jgi:outer membrane protein TolC
MPKFYCFLSFALALLQFIRAQNQPPQYFSLGQFLELILAYHPIVKQAALLPEEAKAELMIAKGAFDPGLDIHWNQKRLFNKDQNWIPATYYRNWNNFLKIPAYWADFKIGFEQYLGINVNPENFTPKQGLYYIEVNAPIGRNTLIDQRRVAIKTAEYLQQINQAEQIKIINKLLLEAVNQYWQWYESYQKLKIQEEGLELATFRFNAINQAIEVGDAAPIDSVETRLEVVKRNMSLEEAKINWQNQTLLLSNFLWTEANQPRELPDFAIPYPYDFFVSRINTDLLDSLQNYASFRRPEIIKQQTKLLQYQLEKRLRKNELLPYIDMDFKPFLIPQSVEYGFVRPYDAEYWKQNFKIGINFYMPLFLRKERGKLNKAILKIKQGEYELLHQKREIETELNTSYNQTKNLERLLILQQQTVEYSQRMLEAEQVKFDNGESSLFIINRRERSLLSEKEKLIELQTKYAKTTAQFYFASGIPISYFLK